MMKDTSINEEESYSLTPDEISDVYLRVINMFPDDSAAQEEVAKFRGACVLLHKIFGQEWYEINIAPHDSAKPTFVRRSLSEDLDRYLFVMRVIQLAEALSSLRKVQDLSLHVEECRRNTMGGEAIQSTWFEFWVPYLIQLGGHKIEEFVPGGENDKTPDLRILYRGHHLAVEVKAKQEETAYSGRGLLRLLNKAFAQIPEDGPGVIFLMIPTQWMEDSIFQDKAAGVLKRALIRHPNCNALFVFWPINQKLPTGEFLYSWRFRDFITTQPTYHVASIDELVSKREMAYEPMPVSFLKLNQTGT